MENLKELFEETLKDIYFAEKQIIKALPKMAKKTKSPELKKAFEEHTEQTKGQVERLDQVFKLLGKKASGKECPALLGLVEEAEDIMSEAKDPDVLNAGLIGAAQAVEHYEIARYGTLVAWAEQLNMRDVAKLLEATLKEEKTTDEKLSKLAVSGGINATAERENGVARAPAKKAAASAKSAPEKSTPAKTTATKSAAAKAPAASKSVVANKSVAASKSAAKPAAARKK